MLPIYVNFTPSMKFFEKHVLEFTKAKIGFNLIVDSIICVKKAFDNGMLLHEFSDLLDFN